MRITIDAAPREQDGECDDDCEMDHRGEEERGLHGASGAKFGARRVEHAPLGVEGEAELGRGAVERVAG